MVKFPYVTFSLHRAVTLSTIIDEQVRYTEVANLLTLQINTFDELIDIINTHPEWRQKLVKALFPEIDVAKALQELIETNRQMRVQLGDIDARLAEIDARQARMEERQTHMEERQTRMEDWQTHTEDWKTDTTRRLVHIERDIGDLKGDNYENGFIRRADAIFGLFLRRGHDARPEIANQLEAAEEAGQIKSSDYDLVIVADLLWSGRSKYTRNSLTLVAEISWFAGQHDIDRAISRAAVLRQIGLQAMPVVAANVWTDELRAAATQQGVAIVDEYRADKRSWDVLLTPAT